MLARRVLLAALVLVSSCASDRARVGANHDGAIVVPTRQEVKPAGQTITFAGRPVDLVLSPDRHWLYAKDNRGIIVIDTKTWKLTQELEFGKDIGGSMHGIAVSPDGKHVYATSAQKHLFEFVVAPDGVVSLSRTILLPGPKGNDDSHPTGIALMKDAKIAFVCLSRNNIVAVLDLTSGTIMNSIPTGVAPYAIVHSANGPMAFVSNWGGRHPRDSERSAPSSGTQVLIDERGVGASGTVSVIDLASQKVIHEIDAGLHPTDMALSHDGEMLYVANANSDSVTTISLRTWQQIGTIKPTGTNIPGSAPNAVLLDEESNRLYVANAGNNAIAVVSLEPPSPNVAKAENLLIPAGWYPGALERDGRYVYVASVKGLGSRLRKTELPSWEVYSFSGTISRIPIPTDSQLAAYSQTARKGARFFAFEPSNAEAIEVPMPIPKHDGEPSLIKHVVYIIKENRTYDQVFGDMKQSNADPALCVFGREVTPNHHAIAEQFVLLDNYYCNGVCSADGHSWATEGNVTDSLEKSFGGFTRSYTFGDDPLTFSSSGFVWDYVIDKGLSFRNYGEFRYTNITPKETSFLDVLRAYQGGQSNFAFTHSIGVERVQQHTAPDSPGWNLTIPDEIRADVFLKELGECEKTGDWPSFMIVYLPQDHTSGTKPGMPTPRAHVADNDLALGRIVEGISKSKFWPETAIFVNEDDPQDGFDHVDGHRSLCLVISPYARRGKVVSEFYNQTSVLHTIGRIFGIAPWTQMVAIAPVMSTCFTEKPDLTPYEAKKNIISLDEMNPAKQALSGTMRNMAEASMTIDFDHVDAANEDTLNRIIWHSVKGEVAYPAKFAGAHGRGLRAMRLRLTKDIDDD